jgi:hypothetical protein
LRVCLTRAQFPQELTTPKVRFPKIIHHQKAEATIYGKKKNYHLYRNFTALTRPTVHKP